MRKIKYLERFGAQILAHEEEKERRLKFSKKSRWNVPCLRLYSGIYGWSFASEADNLAYVGRSGWIRVTDGLYPGELWFYLFHVNGDSIRYEGVAVGIVRSALDQGDSWRMLLRRNDLTMNRMKQRCWAMRGFSFLVERRITQVYLY